MRALEFSHSTSGINTFRESELQHFESMTNCEWLLGKTKVVEQKNYVGLFSSNVEGNIDKMHYKVGLIFASSFDRRKS